MLPQLQHDISALADFSDTYNSAADDLLAVLDNLSITNRTVADQREQLRRTFTVTTGMAQTTTSFLSVNEQNLISLAATSRPVLGLLAKYSPEYPCLLDGLTRSVDYQDRVWSSEGHPGLQLNITVLLPPRNPYVPGDQPQYLDKRGPDCRGLDNIDAILQAAQAGRYYCPTAPNDGIRSPDNPISGNPRCLGGTGPDDVPPGAGSTNPQAGQSLAVDLAGTTAELDFVRSLIGYQSGTDPKDVSDLSATTLAPLLRGTQVMVQ